MKKIIIIIVLISSGLIINASRFKVIKIDERSLHECRESHGADGWINTSFVNGNNHAMSTTGSGILSANDFMTSFFYNQTQNYPVNYKDSCGYVSMAQLLSYYDTFLNDSIVPEQYDVNSVSQNTDIYTRGNSPGVERDLMYGQLNPNLTDILYVRTNMTAQAYFDNIVTKANTSLHAKLITIGESLGYYKYSSNLAPAGTFYDEREEILKAYLNDVVGLEENIDYTLHKNYIGQLMGDSYSGQVRDWIVSKIQAGYPVLVSNKSSVGAHAAIAYEYDEEHDNIYIHGGRLSNETKVTFEEWNLWYYKTAIAIEFHLPHAHSNNYGVSEANSLYVTYYCSCLEVINPHAQCTYTYQRYNERMHKLVCECGDFYTSPHAVRPVGSHIRWVNCLLCGELIDIWKTPVLAWPE